MFSMFNFKGHLDFIFLLFLLFNTFGCLFSDTKMKLLNTCEPKPNFQIISCPDQDTSSRNKLVTLLDICNSDPMSLPTLPITQIRSCRKNIVMNFSNIQTEECKQKFVENVRCVLRKNLTDEIPNLVLANKEKDKLQIEHLVEFYNEFKDWYLSTIDLIYNSQALYENKKNLLQESDNMNLEKNANYFSANIQEQDQIGIFSAFWNQILKVINRENSSLRYFDFGTQNSINMQIATSVLDVDKMPAPLLFRLLGQSLKPTSERLQFLSEIVDVGCRIDFCHKFEVTDEITALVLLYGSLSNKSDFLHTFDRVEKSVNSIDQKLFFQKMKNRIEPIGESIFHFLKENMNVNNFKNNNVFEAESILKMELHNSPSYARELLSIVQSNLLRKQTFEKRGEFSIQNNDQSEFGFSSNINAIDQILSKSDMELSEAKNEFIQQRDKYEANILTDMDTVRSINQLKNNIENELVRIANIGDDLNGLKMSLVNEETRFATYLNQAQSTLSNERYLGKYGNANLNITEGTTISISPENAPKNFSITNLQSMATVKLFPQQVNDVLTNSLLLLKIEQNWSPTCALKKGGFKDELINGAIIGPEGFVLQNVDGKTKLHSVTEYKQNDRNSTNGSSSSACSRTAGSSNLFNAVSFEQSYAECLNSTYNVSSSDGRRIDDTESESIQNLTQFVVGIKSQHTPFAALPAGSLLVLQVKRGSNFASDIVAIDVAQRNSAILIKDDVDLYFIVNDCLEKSGSANTLKSNSLTIQASLLKPEKITAKNLLDAMITTLKVINFNSEELLKRGQISFQDLNTLRSKISNQLAIQGYVVSEVGPLISQLINYWIDLELNTLDIKSRIILLDRELKLRLLAIGQMEEQIHQLESQKTIQTIFTVWSLSNVDLDDMKKKLGNYVSRLRRFIIPVISFQSPNRMNLIRKSKFAENLKKIELNTQLDLIFEDLIKINNSIINSKIDDDIISPTLNHAKIGISFSNPNHLNKKAGLDKKDNYSDWPKAPEIDSEKIWTTWNNYNENEGSDNFLTFSVKPEYLYGNDPLKLSCDSAVAPVIDSLGIYFVVDDSLALNNINALPLTAHIEASGPLVFPQENGPQLIELVGPYKSAWLRQSIPFGFGESTNALSVLSKVYKNQKSGVGGGAGLSPFMNFTIDIDQLGFGKDGRYRHLASKITEIILVFDIQFRQSMNNLSWLSTCSK